MVSVEHLNPNEQVGVGADIGQFLEYSGVLVLL